MKINVYLCIDEHGNWQAVGSSKENDMNRGQFVELAEFGIKNDTVNTMTTSFKVDVQLPSPKESTT